MNVRSCFAGSKRLQFSYTFIYIYIYWHLPLVARTAGGENVDMRTFRTHTITLVNILQHNYEYSAARFAKPSTCLQGIGHLLAVSYHSQLSSHAESDYNVAQKALAMRNCICSTQQHKTCHRWHSQTAKRGKEGEIALSVDSRYNSVRFGNRKNMGLCTTQSVTTAIDSCNGNILDFIIGSWVCSTGCNA